MEERKICCAIPSLSIGGMERVMSILINSFVERHHAEVHLLLFGINREIHYPISDKVIIHKPTFAFDNKHRKYNTLRTICFIRHEISAINPCCVLSFGNYWNSLVLLSCYGKKVPIYVSDRSSPLKNMGKTQNMLRNYLYPKAAGVIFQTKKAQEIGKKLFTAKKSTIIGNPIRQVAERNDVARLKNVVTVGRLIETKHYDRLVKLFHELNRADWNLVIVGGDAQKQNRMAELRKQLAEYGNPSNIVLAGAQSDVDAYLLESSIFAFTSSSEGFPNAIGEAMSAGLPVVSYDCVAGPSDLIEDGETGFLVKQFDDEAFKNRLSILMNDEEARIRMGTRAKKRIKQFDVDSISDKFYDFITSNLQ